MLDIRFIRENAELVEKKAEQKGYKINIKHLLQLDEDRRRLLAEIEATRAQRNELAEQLKDKKPTEEDLVKGQGFKKKLKELELELDPVETEFNMLLASVPNVFPDDTPLGGEENNREEKKWGDTAEKDFEVIDHLTWGEQHGLIDFERGAKVAGNKFYFLKSDLVELEMALLQFSLGLAKKHGFWLMSVPHMVNTRILEGAGFSARGKEKQVYKIEDEDLNLIATAEIPLTGFFADEILPGAWLPSKMAAWSPAYRVEGGAYGKHNRGLYRVHQFNKVELYVLCLPKDSEDWHQKLLKLEEELCQTLEIPYRIVQIAAGDLGAPAYKKFDVEYFTPVDKTYRELMSCSNVTDYQARRLDIRHKDEQDNTQFVHTLNATLAATSRLLIAIIENHQDKDGKVKIPKALQSYMHGQTTI
ncbi:serine--tRNA ligase [bacterium G20]|nr:serine--tRNA ligase [bacterium G20]